MSTNEGLRFEEAVAEVASDEGWGLQKRWRLRRTSSSGGEGREAGMRRGGEEGGVSLRWPWISAKGEESLVDIWYHIHSLLPLRDAARAACVSSTFLYSWRCRPNLIFSKKTLGLNGNWRENVRELVNKVDHIMKNHSGIGLRTFGLQSYNLINTYYLDRWLNIAITPAIEELSLTQFPENNTKYYNFPCSILFNRGGNSIKHICLSHCAFRPTGGLNFLRRLHLGEVHITGDELECLLSNSFALEQLTLKYCKELNYLRIPCQLQQLKDLEVYERKALQMMEVKAPNLSTFHYDGNLARLSDGGLLAVKKLRISSFYQYNNVHYASANLSSIVPTIETLIISSFGEVY
nr:uncharacterized protein LOC107276590 [Oryza sativa Japonica Group]